MIFNGFLQWFIYNDILTMILVQWFWYNDLHTTISIQRFWYNDLYTTICIQRFSYNDSYTTIFFCADTTIFARCQRFGRVVWKWWSLSKNPKNRCILVRWMTNRWQERISCQWFFPYTTIFSVASNDFPRWDEYTYKSAKEVFACKTINKLVCNDAYKIILEAYKLQSL